MKRGLPFHPMTQYPTPQLQEATPFISFLGIFPGILYVYKTTYDYIAPPFKHTHKHALHITLHLVFLPAVFPIVSPPLTICETDRLANTINGVEFNWLFSAIMLYKDMVYLKVSSDFGCDEMVIHFGLSLDILTLQSV